MHIHEYLPSSGLSDVDFRSALQVTERLNYDQYCNIRMSLYDSTDVTEGDCDCTPQLRNIIKNCQYYEVDDFISLIRRNKNLSDCSIVTLCLNIRSIPKNLSEFVLDLGDIINQLDFLCFTETRLHDGIVPLYMLDNFSMFENSRDSRGGGVAIYARQL